MVVFPPLVISGIDLFNRGEFFEAHEDLEGQWRKETGPIRDLYQALVQVSVVFYHLERGNLNGAIKVLQTALPKLRLFSDVELPIALEILIAELERIQQHLLKATHRSPPVNSFTMPIQIRFRARQPT